MVEVKDELKVVKSLILKDGRVISETDSIEFVDTQTGEKITATVEGLKTKSNSALLKFIAVNCIHKVQEISFDDIDELTINNSTIIQNSNFTIEE